MTTGRINQIAIHVFLTAQPFKAGLSGIRPGLQRFRTFLPKGVFHIHSLERGERTTCHENRRPVLSCVPLASRLNLQAFASEHPSRTTRLDRGSIALPMGSQLLTERHSGTINTHYCRSCDRCILGLVSLWTLSYDPCMRSLSSPVCPRFREAGSQASQVLRSWL